MLSGFGDAGGQVLADGGQPGALGRVDAEQGTADATVLVYAAGSPGPAALAEGDLAPLEVAEELVPLGVGYPGFE